MTTTIVIPQEKQTFRKAGRRLIWVSLFAMLAASAANLGLYAVAGSIFPEVTAWSGARVGQIIGSNIVYLLLAAISFAIITRFSSRPARSYLMVATISLIFLLIMSITAGFGFGPPGTPPADTVTVITLSLMHFMAFAISVPLFIRINGSSQKISKKIHPEVANTGQSEWLKPPGIQNTSK